VTCIAHSYARALLLLTGILVATTTVAEAQAAGGFTRTGDMRSARSEHSATLLADGRVLIAGGDAGTALASAEIFDPTTGAFYPTGALITARRMHTATLLPDNRVLIVGGYGYNGALASAELFDPATGTFSTAGNLIAARSGHTAILLPTGQVLIIGGYGTHTYPDVAPAELYDPILGTFSAAAAYTGHGGCDFCAPSVLLPDGTILFPGQYPAQLYDPARDVFRPIGMMISDQSTAAVLMNGQVLFAGGEGCCGRLAIAEVYRPADGTFVATTNMASRRAWHSLNLLPNGLVLAAGGETEACSGNFCSFAGTLASAELYDPSRSAFVVTGSMSAAREVHSATLLPDGRILMAGGVSYGGIGLFGGSLASADLYTPDVLVPSPVLASLSGDGTGQGVVFHAGTSYLAGPDDPAVAGEDVDIQCAGLSADSAIAPQAAIGGRAATVLSVTAMPNAPGLTLVRIRIPSGIPSGPVVPIRLTYLDRPTNQVTIALR
jgi:hypothetical protein